MILEHFDPLINIYDSHIGKNTKIANFVEVGGAFIGDDCKIQAFTSIPPGTTIGNRCFIGPGVRFPNSNYPSIGEGFEQLGSTIEDDVVIGANCIIMPGITIGSGSFISAGVLVNKNIPANSFVSVHRALNIKPISVLNILRRWRERKHKKIY